MPRVCPLPAGMLDGAEAFDALKQLADTGDVVIIFFNDDEYEVTRARVTMIRTTLRDAIMAQLNPDGPEKRCIKCSKIKKLTQFPSDTSKPDGKFHTCIECERPRWRKVRREVLARQKKARAFQT